MKSYRKVIEMHVRARMGFVNLTPQVRAALNESGVREGLCLSERHEHNLECVHQR
jgi:thiamine phosphate synthase YjbQ (UPF0047 family)